jgi:dihydrodipicolinate synthase/N-acetylneuraminate lyase
MPWNEDETLDRAALRRLVARCALNGSDGIYVAGTAGEFHSMDLTQFEDVVATFLQEARKHPGLDHQVGCGAFSLAQVLRRVRIALAQGARTIQLNLPGWTPLTDDEVVDFYTRVSREEPGMAIVVYDSAACGRVIGADLWKRLLEALPAIVGAKIARTEPGLSAAIKTVRPEFRFYTTEGSLDTLAMEPVDGIAAWMGYAFPPILSALWRARSAGDKTSFEDALAKIRVLDRIKAEVRPRGYRAGIMDRLMGLASGFLEPVFARVLAPWRCVDDADVRHVRRRIVETLGPSALYRPDV